MWNGMCMHFALDRLDLMSCVSLCVSLHPQDDDQLKTWLVALVGGVFGLFFVATVFLCTWKAIASHWYEMETPKALMSKEPPADKKASLFSWQRSEERRVGKGCVSTCRARWS